MNTLSRTEIEQVIRELLHKYHAEYALLFGSYARGEATAASDIDVIVVGGANFRPRDILLLGRSCASAPRRTWMPLRSGRSTPALPSMKASCGRGSRSHEEIGQGAPEKDRCHMGKPESRDAQARHYAGASARGRVFPVGLTTPLYNIGEQVYQLSPEFKASYPEQPWNMVAGLRHRLVHDYDGINWSIIVEVLFEDMEPFVTAVNAILAGM